MYFWNNKFLIIKNYGEIKMEFFLVLMTAIILKMEGLPFSSELFILSYLLGSVYCIYKISIELKLKFSYY